MKRAEILEAARVCVCGEREQDYGTPENNFETIGLLWGIYLRAAHPELAKVMTINHITAKDVAAMMGLLKVAGLLPGTKRTALWTWLAMRRVPVRLQLKRCDCYG